MIRCTSLSSGEDLQCFIYTFEIYFYAEKNTDSEYRIEYRYPNLLDKLQLTWFYNNNERPENGTLNLLLFPIGQDTTK